MLNPNSTAAHTAAMLATARRVLATGYQVDGLTLADAPPLLASPADLQAAASALARLPAQAFAGFDAVLLAAFGDPGSAALRARLRVPLLGIGACAIQAAAAHGRFAIVTITPELQTAIASQVAHHGCAAQYAGLRLTGAAAQTLLDDPSALREALAQCIEATLAEEALAAVIIGGGPLVAAAEALQGRFDVALINPLEAACRQVRALWAGD
nr:aspartate/glutamate racemase family protein [Pseudomonas insulae]